MNIFCSPCFPMQKLFDTYVEFLKLEKTEMGGMKGKMLGQQVEKIHEEFLECIKVFTESQYDALDPMCKVLYKCYGNVT